MKKWVKKNVNYDTKVLEKRYGITKITAEILLSRGFKSINEIDEYINPFKVKLTAAEKILNLTYACDIIKQSIKSREKIMIIGDYDVDGVMSSYILLKGLTAFGADAFVRLPDRVKDGYGMRDYMVDEAISQNVKLIITCDNGISAFEAVDYAVKKGIKIVVTDHHDVPKADGEDKLVNADCVVDCKRKDETYPFHEMCGAGLCYRLIQYMAGKDSKYHDMLIELMVFAAIATVCDVVPLIKDNRVIVSYGLKYIKKVNNPGLKALIELCDFKNGIDSYSFGFRIGPAINAAGRLENADIALSLFMEEDDIKAREKAEKLLMLNDQRKQITESAVKQAITLYDDNNMKDDKILIMYLPDCSEAVAGIVAGRIKKKYYKPTFVIVNSNDILKGSGRSIDSYHMQEALSQVSSYTIASGGHRKAAGFSLEKDKLNDFCNALKENVTLTEDDLTERLKVDVVAGIDEIDIKTINELKLFAPFGEANKKIKFADKDIYFHRVFLCGKENKVGRFAVKKGGKDLTVICFDVEEGIKKDIIEKYDESAWESLINGSSEGIVMNLLYEPVINSYNNQIQFTYIDAC